MNDKCVAGFGCLLLSLWPYSLVCRTKHWNILRYSHREYTLCVKRHNFSLFVFMCCCCFCFSLFSARQYLVNGCCRRRILFKPRCTIVVRYACTKSNEPCIFYHFTRCHSVTMALWMLQIQRKRSEWTIEWTKSQRTCAKLLGQWFKHHVMRPNTINFLIR